MAPMKLIPLTKGKFTKVDDEDYEYLMQWKWRLGSPDYAVRSVYVGKINGQYTYQFIPMHRVITGAKKGQVVDHIDRDGLNNQRANLRKCTQRQNTFNRGKFQTKHLKGVQFLKGAWQAYAKVDGKAVYLGRFPTEHLSGLARDLWAVDLHGEYADTNFPIINH
jgi:HNH endonuclease